MCLALQASGLWLRYATLQNLIPSFPWIAPPHPPPWRNPRKGRDQILLSGNLGQGQGGLRRRDGRVVGPARRHGAQDDNGEGGEPGGGGLHRDRRSGRRVQRVPISEVGVK